MLSTRYESIEVDSIIEVDIITLLYVPSGTLWSTSSDTHKVV